jgi:hypothetical protein
VNLFLRQPLADLLKNHLTKHIKTKNPQSDEVKVKWKQLLETIEGSSADLKTDAFVHHFWLSKYDYLSAKHLFKILKKRITADQASAFLDALLEDSVLYRSMNEPGYGKWTKEEKEIARALSATVTFRVVQQTPCVLSVLREYRVTKKLKKSMSRKLSSLLRSFTFYSQQSRPSARLAAFPRCMRRWDADFTRRMTLMTL